MEIFGIGPAELILILIVAFIVLGPERLPAVARALGKWAYQLRKMSSEFTRQLGPEMDGTLRDIQSARDDIRGLSNQITTPLRTEMHNAAQEIKAIQTDVQQAGQSLTEINLDGSKAPEPPVESFKA